MDDSEESSKIHESNPSGRPPDSIEYPRAPIPHSKTTELATPLALSSRRHDSEETSKLHELNPYARSPGSFKYSRASTTHSKLAEPATPLSRKFEILLNRHLESRTEAGMDNSEAINYLLHNLHSVEETDSFFRETAKYFDETPPYDCDIVKLRTHLSTANWMTGGEDLEFVYSALRRGVFTDLDDELYEGELDYIPLGMFNDFALALQIDIGAMVPQEADSTTIESCKVFSVTSNRILGARYDSIIPGKGKETMIFAQFGKIFYTPGNPRLRSETTGYTDSGFVLVLEIQSSGLPGAFYIMCNLTWDDDYQEMTDEEVYDDPNLLKFCGTERSFTVARVEGQGVDLLHKSWEEVSKEDKDMEFKEVSVRIPEIVETGWRRHNGGQILVGLFQDLEV